MTSEQRQKLREAAQRAWYSGRGPTPWVLQTSNSFRRIGTDRDGDVLCASATTHPIDRHPDLTAQIGVLDYIVAAQPPVVLELLDQLDAAEQLLQRLAEVETRLDETDRKFREAQVLVEQLRAAAKAHRWVP